MNQLNSLTPTPTCALRPPYVPSQYSQPPCCACCCCMRTRAVYSSRFEVRVCKVHIALPVPVLDRMPTLPAVVANRAFHHRLSQLRRPRRVQRGARTEQVKRGTGVVGA
eukprot:COSAG06_NODE_8_length_37897_cov_42.611884_11_plen_109_part_00